VIRLSKKHYFVFLFAFLGFIVVYYREHVLVSFGEYLVTESPLEKADAIVVLSGSIPDRILEAVDLYKGGYASLIILTKSEKPPAYDELLRLGVKIPEGHEINKGVAMKLGIPGSAVITVDKRVNSTYAEVKALNEFLKEHNIDSIILVTSKFHTTRATKLFKFVSGKDIKIVTRPSRYDTFNPESWWKERRDLKQVIYEYQKLAYYYVFLKTEALLF
jgi:uncharacterized SAM-binding protein YcdF (DUF218 family)